jgi:hypothetical protein
VLEEQTTCKSGALIQDGSKFSSTRTANLSTGRAKRFLMLEEQRMKKEDKLESGVTTEVHINNGQLSILIKQRAHKPRESTRTLASMSTDHSILFQNSHSIELLSATVPTTFG